MHVAEMKKEWEDSEKANGMSPVEYLENIGSAGAEPGGGALHFCG